MKAQRARPKSQPSCNCFVFHFVDYCGVLLSPAPKGFFYDHIEPASAESPMTAKNMRTPTRLAACPIGLGGGDFEGACAGKHMVAVKGGEGDDVFVATGLDQRQGSRCTIAGLSVCHWPGGQLRVSNADRKRVDRHLFRTDPTTQG